MTQRKISAYLTSLALALSGLSGCLFKDKSKLHTDHDEQSASNTRIGYFISSADPVTLGHLNLLKQFTEDLSITELHVIVNSVAVKDYSGSDAERLEMFEAGRKDVGINAEFTIVTEPERGKTNYVANLISKGAGRAYGIIGEDVQDKAYELFKDLDGLELYVAARSGESELQANRKLPEIRYEHPMFRPFHLRDVNDISSTLVKKRLSTGAPTQDILSPSVRAYIHLNGLYRGLSDEQFRQHKEPFLRNLVSAYKQELASHPDLRLYSFPSTIKSFTNTQSRKGTFDMLARTVIRSNEMSYAEQAKLREFTTNWSKSAAIQALFDEFELNLRKALPAVAVLTDQLSREDAGIRSVGLDYVAVEEPSETQDLELLIEIDNLARKHNGRAVVFCRPATCQALEKISAIQIPIEFRRVD